MSTHIHGSKARTFKRIGQNINIKIDLVFKADVQALVEVWNLCFPEFLLSEQGLEKQLFSDFGLDPAGCFVARRGSSEIAGFTIGTTQQIPYTGRNKLPGCLPVLAVKPKFWRKGIGTQLLQSVEQYLVAQKVKKIRLGYPTYLRGTALSLIGVNTEWHEAIRFFEYFGYAPRGVLDSMSIDLDGWSMPPEVAQEICAGREKKIEFGSLYPTDIHEFLEFLKRDFAGSWYDQMAYLQECKLLVPSENLVVKEHGKICGFAGPFHVAENGDTCGIGLGISPHLRGKGLGSLLLYILIQRVKETGGKRITLFGAVDKVKYYGKMSFKPSSIWLFMEKDIT